MTVIYCEDGYIEIDSTFDYLNSLTQKNTARMTLKYGSSPRDLQLGSRFITITNEDGSGIKLIKKADLRSEDFSVDTFTSPSA